ncbi:transporter substrate-binding domain-containing protein [Pseudalkalibacillus berkeleyi]|uniref:Transporter substrate-binding domain-containing protein n=1 Tax=Pseudalkalibacillus berkeleyi TaxID=1069813 RepID=A0ABS9H2Q7_9BACL|nr:transporter substrate-binding domain-containing protein [Pseudalkalibacillus berkeleyi]MCF6138127.1 transporter substrate-binding domain-containing protein [Pseudalkalibacillus berkeleyi]
MKKFSLWATMLLAFSLLLAACGGSDSGNGEGESKYDLAESDKFTFASSGEFAPFSTTDASGEMSGFDIEVAEAVAKELGLEPNQEKFKFASIVEGVKTGRFDAAVASHTITDERKKAVDFSTPYYYSGPQIFTRPDSDIQTLDDLKGKEIAVSKGSTYAKTAKEVTDQIRVYDSDVTALEALSKGKHDAVITDFVTGKEAIGKGFKIEARELLGRSEQAIAVSKENEQLLKDINKALETLREDGTLKELSKKYFGEDITTKPE